MSSTKELFVNNPSSDGMVPTRFVFPETSSSYKCVSNPISEGREPNNSISATPMYLTLEQSAISGKAQLET